MNHLNVSFREGDFDIAVVAGPRLESWPSAGVRALSLLCAEMGLKVGVFGGDSLSVKGVVPSPGTGGVAIVQDSQGRIHRIRARAIVRVSAPSEFPDPFPGWRSTGLVPLATALRLRADSHVRWEPGVAILGTGNRALRFGSSLLESGVPEVICFETRGPGSAGVAVKRYSGWEVERRRFEMAGGKVIEAQPVSLTQKSPLLWEFRARDSQGVRVQEVARVVSAGPFHELAEVREHPPGSMLFELLQSAPEQRTDDVEGWALEEERGRYLATRIVRALGTDLGAKREELDKIYRRARGRMRRYLKHRAEPFAPSYQGKWTAGADLKAMREFRGLPQSEHKKRPIAALECFEEIPCNVCQTVCPSDAIRIGHVPRTQDTLLTEANCTSCGLCVRACPSGVIPMIHEREDRSTSQVMLPWRGLKLWKPGEVATLLNRKGDTLGSARVVATDDAARPQLVTLEVPSHLVWEARGLRRSAREAEVQDLDFVAATQAAKLAPEKVEILLNGEKRVVRDEMPVSLSLFEIGRSRPSDVLLCSDGSCRMCEVTVDGVKKLGCQTLTHRGMSVRAPLEAEPRSETPPICPCLGITREELVERMKHGKLSSPDAVISLTHVGEGRCHGQLCMEAVRRVLIEEGIDAGQWVDWRFPWSDWELNHF